MKRTPFLALLLCLYASIVASQNTPFCGSEAGYTNSDTLDVPWYGDNEYLYRILEEKHEFITDSAERTSIDCSKDIQSPLAIPIRFWVWEASPGESEITEANLQHQMSVLNREFENNGLNIRFHLRCPQFPIDNDLINIGDNAEFNNLNNNGAQDQGALNVHVVNSGSGNNGPWGGKYGDLLFNDYVAIVRTTFNEASDEATTLVHEIGHYFGLDHTHRFTEDAGCCKAEPVTRGKKWHNPCIGCEALDMNWYNRRCSRTGDYLCDTPADPLGSAGFSDCIFNETEWTDQYGETYSPDVSNHMSYYPSVCARSFSKTQKAIILEQIFFNPLREFILDESEETIKPDRYEPDDTDAVGVPVQIDVNEIQCHSMNVGSSMNCIATDEDWLRISNRDGVLGGYKIIVRDLDDFDNPVAEVFIHNTDNGGMRTDAIAINFIDNGSERIWEIPCGIMAPNTATNDPYDFNDFLVQITRTAGVVGLYEVKLEKLLNKNPRLTEREQVCVGSEFHITTLPENATVTWTAQNLTLSNTTGASTTVTNTATQNPFITYSITAVVELDGCTYRLSDTFSEIATSQLPTIGSITMDVVGNTCEPQFTFSVPEVEGAVYYEWSCTSNVSAPATFYGCYGESDFGGISKAHASAYLPNGENIELYITITASNDCGATVTESQAFEHRPEGDCNVHGGGIRSVSITPNPVSDGMFALNIEDDALTAQDYNIVIMNQYGNIAWMIESQEKVHQISTVTFLNGLYYAEVISNTNLVSTAFYIQN